MGRPTEPRPVSPSARMFSHSAQSAASQPAQPQRLPVNPRRHKVAADARKRVIRACNNCNVRRVKCTGLQPCERCVKGGRDCEYSAPETDKNAMKSEVERLLRRCAALEEQVRVISPDTGSSFIQQLDQREISIGQTTWMLSEPSEADDDEAPSGRLLQDEKGNRRFHGESSGATFLDKLKLFMVRLVDKSFPNYDEAAKFLDTFGKYQTYDWRPFPEPDVDPAWLPPDSDLLRVLQQLRYQIQDGAGEYPSGGIYWWNDMSLLPMHTTPASMSAMTTADTNRHYAFYHICCALVSEAASSTYPGHDTQPVWPSFTRAKMLLGNPLDVVSFTKSDIPALTLMGFCLIEFNRRDAAYMYVSLAVHIAIIHGAFRRAESEAEKRIFWTLFIMDRWLSALMGRPPVLAMQAITLPPPEDDPSMPPAAGLHAHVQLATISDYIVCETYQIAPRRRQPDHLGRHIEHALTLLSQWEFDLPPTLVISNDSNRKIDPACYLLHMTRNQLVILATRPVFWAAVKEAANEPHRDDHWSIDLQMQSAHVRACSQAADRNLHLARCLQPVRKRLQADLHFIFNAAVVLLLDRIILSVQTFTGVGHTIRSPNRDSYHATEIAFAIEAFEQEHGTTYPRDCLRTLQNLKAIVDHYLAQRWNHTERTFKRDSNGYDPQLSSAIEKLSEAKTPPANSSCRPQTWHSALKYVKNGYKPDVTDLAI